MDRLGKVDLTPAEEQALHLVDALDKVEAKTQRVRDEIANNQDDYATWAGNIKLVTDVMGGNGDALDKLIGQYQDGTITWDQFTAAVDDPSFAANFEKITALENAGTISHKKANQARAASTDLIKRSVGGMQDERN